MNITKISALLLFLPLAFAACSGGGDGSAAEPAATPTAAADRRADPTAAPDAPGVSGSLSPNGNAQPLPPAEPVETPEPYNPDPYADFPTFAPEPEPEPQADVETTSWRIYSEAIYYDAGGGGAAIGATSRDLQTSSDGTWAFGDSAGTWYVAEITDQDWNYWGVDPYGPTSKIVLDGWNGDVAAGPIEGTDGYVDFIWVIYREGPPTIGAPGTVWMKFGHW
ncbi:MAG: hypothetical protein Q7T33_07275 [Dehalococcoidia bacterium]|nr:hypothetical protein [Dehalococcoidia bacterium]